MSDIHESPDMDCFFSAAYDVTVDGRSLGDPAIILPSPQ